MEPILLRTRVKMRINKRNIHGVIAIAQGVHDGMSAASADFPAPPTPMAVFQNQIADLVTAEQATTTRTRGTTAVRDAKAKVVVATLDGLMAYVQGLCDASPARAATLISEAAMSVVKKGSRHKALLTASNGTASGSALLSANRTALLGKARGHGTLHWQYSLDGGKTWVNAPSTPLATTEIQGLPPLTTVAFRVAATIGKVTGEWSQAVTLLVK